MRNFGYKETVIGYKETKPLCAICEKNEAEIEVSGDYPLPELICMECYAHPDYQVILNRDNLKRKLI